MSKIPHIGIVDCKIGNLFSVLQMCNHVGFKTTLLEHSEKLNGFDGIILPGVGAFGEAITNLRENGMDKAIVEFVKSGKPMLGVCLGMQLCFSESEEFGNFKGLDLVRGKIKKFDSSVVGKVPQIAWNKIHKPAENSWKNTILEGLEEGEYMYFVHSFYAQPEDRNDVLSTTSYNGFKYCSSVKKENIQAVQFHPEKSSKQGELIYRNWFKQF